MKDSDPTTKQIVTFTVLLSFIASIIGTVLTLGVFGPLFGVADTAGGPLQINRPGILERIKETVVQSEVEITERVLRQDELVVQVVEKMSPAVVSIVATKDVPIIEQYFVNPFQNDPFFKDFFGNDSFQIPQLRQKGTEKVEVSSGTGFLVSGDGLIVSNKHVVADTEADYTVLMNDGRKIAAKVLARDPLQDLAFLKIEGSNFSYLDLSKSSDVKIGQTVIAIGNALGEFSNTVSVGIVSGLQRSIIASGSGGSEILQELIQTDAAINPGNSGGPLLNLRGEVVGINTAVARGAENIGFAIPASKAKRDLENIQKFGKIVYPFIGVRYVIITKEFAEKEKLARDFGVLLVAREDEPAVVLESPAHKAGLKAGDIIIEINGQKLTPEKSLADVLQKYNAGDEVTVKVVRNNTEFEKKIVLGER